MLLGFITTDNPGFAVDEQTVHNIKLRGNFRFYFPLSPRHCLMLGDGKDGAYFRNRKKKTIIYRACSDKVVLQINNAQLTKAYSYAIADDEDFIGQIKLLQQAKDSGNRGR